MSLADIDVAILCGGRGTRLKPVIGDLPKVLAPIKGRPFIEWHLDYLKDQGARNFTLITGYGSDRVERWLNNYPRGDIYPGKIEIVKDVLCAGGGAALAQALPKLTGYHTLITNGDTLLSGDLGKIIPEMVRHEPSVVTVGGRSSGVTLLSGKNIAYREFFAFPIEVLFDFSFLDIGTPEGYARAESWLSENIDDHHKDALPR